MTARVSLYRPSLASATGDDRRSRSAALLRALAVGGWLLAFLSVSVSLAVWAARGWPTLPISYASGPFGILGLVTCAMVYATLGGLIAHKLGRNPIGWLLLLVGVVVSLVLPATLLVSDALSVLRPAPTPLVLAAWIISAVTAPTALTAVTVAVMLFPTGGTLSGRWSMGPWVAVAGGVALALGTALGRMQLWYPALPSPAQVYAVHPMIGTSLQVGGMALLVAASLIATTGLAVRYRAGSPALRAQLQWIVVAGIVLVVAVSPFYVARYGIHLPDETGERLLVLCTVGGSLFPLAVGMGMVRHDLWGLDRVITRTMVYVPLTAMLAGVTAATITLFQRIFVALTGDTSDVAVVFTTLLLAAAFAPVKSALDGFFARALPAVEQPSDAHPGTGVAPVLDHASAGGDQAHALGARDEAPMAHLLEQLQARIAVLEARLDDPRPRSRRLTARRR